MRGKHKVEKKKGKIKKTQLDKRQFEFQSRHSVIIKKQKLLEERFNKQKNHENPTQTLEQHTFISLVA